MHRKVNKIKYGALQFSTRNLGKIWKKNDNFLCKKILTIVSREALFFWLRGKTYNTHRKS